MHTQPLPKPITQSSLGSNETPKQIVITIGSRQIEIFFDKVISLEGCGNYTFIYTSDGKRYLASKTLKWFWSLINHASFVRVHKSAIINWDYFQDICDCERTIKLKNGHELSISRRRTREVKEQASSRKTQRK